MQISPNGNPGRIVEKNDNITSDGGGTSSLQISLKTHPAADVTISINTNFSGVVLSQKNLEFTPLNWSIPQKIYLTGIENLNYFCKIAGEDYNDEALSKILNDCGLDSDVIGKKVGSYSKGMRQKVGIAIAFAKKAKVLLLDEPASGLDPLASTELSSTLKSLAKKGTAVLMASHDIFRVRETCDRIGILKNGSLIDQMDTSKVTTNELEKIYIDYMRG